MKKLTAVGAIMLAGLTLTGCYNSSPESPDESNHSYIKTNDGRVVYCLESGYQLSCDWENAKPVKEKP